MHTCCIFAFLVASIGAAHPDPDCLQVCVPYFYAPMLNYCGIFLLDSCISQFLYLIFSSSAASTFSLPVAMYAVNVPLFLSMDINVDLYPFGSAPSQSQT